MKVAVIGSVNRDIYFEVDRLPQAGETLNTIHPCLSTGGGKGANQAAAAQKLGGDVTFIAQIGNDGQGAYSINGLQECGVDLTQVKTLDNYPTGGAVIILQSNGQNAIIIDGGANMEWNGLSEGQAKAVQDAQILLMQREIPDEINLQAARIARENGTITILDVGGRDDQILPELLQYIDIISPNETELLRITGEASANQAVQKLKELGLQHIVLKEGANGSSYLTSDSNLHQTAFSDLNRPVIDTAGAGDCFTAGLAVGLLFNGGLTPESFRLSMRYASAASFLCVTRKGTMQSMPTKAEVEEFLANN